MRNNAVYANADCRLLPIANQSVHMIATSPPYWGLRDYQVHGQLGNERNSDCLAWARHEPPCRQCYVCNMREVGAEMWRVLRNDGVWFLNLGDSYYNYRPGGVAQSKQTLANHTGSVVQMSHKRGTLVAGLKEKDLCGIPWRVALALQADGWYLRSDIIWCLSGGTYVYARTQKGDGPMTIKDLSRLNPATVQLWNGEKWTRLLGVNKSNRSGNEMEIVLRSGERISCTPSHKFPTERGLLEAGDLVIGDVLQSVKLPAPNEAKDCAIDKDAAWFAGLYIAEGSRSGDTIQIAGHTKETDRLARLLAIAKKFGGSATYTINGNNLNIRIYSRILNAIIDELVTGQTAHDKGFSSTVWRYSDSFIASMVDGYLSGDGAKDGNRWRLGFCRNYNLERDLRTACARLNYRLTLNLSGTKYNGKQVPTYRGELRTMVSGHCNEKDRNEIVKIRKARCRHLYDLGVADAPHVFALASGVLTHNSKPNPMPESVTDRPTKAHEYIFLLTKNQRYFWDAEAVKENQTQSTLDRAAYKWNGRTDDQSNGARTGSTFKRMAESDEPIATIPPDGKRNLRSVWNIATSPYTGSHYAVFPPALVERMIKAGSKQNDIVLDPFCGSGTTLMVARKLERVGLGFDISEKYLHENTRKRLEDDKLYLWNAGKGIEINEMDKSYDTLPLFGTL